MSVPQLPTELIIKILSCMPSSSLAAMQRTCKSFCTLAEPILYREVDIFIQAFILKDTVPDSQPIALLVRTLEERPQIGQLIRAINYIRENPSVQDLFLRHRSQLYGWLGRLIHHCTHLESLRMPGQLVEEVEESEMRESSKKRKHGLSKHQRLQSLKHIDLTMEDGHWDGSYLPRPIKGSISVFFLPNIESIRMELVERGNFRIEDLDGLNATNLTSLQIAKGVLSPQVIGRIKSGAPNLKSLRLELVWDSGWLRLADRDPCFLDCVLLAEALSGRAPDRSPPPTPSLLEHLSIAVEFNTRRSASRSRECQDVIGAYEVTTNEWGIKGSIGTLNQFRHLQSLEIPIIVLFGWHDRDVSLRELLPSSLKRLRLRLDCSGVKNWEWDWETSNLRQILTNYGQGGPLESVHFVSGCNTTKDSEAYPAQFLFE